ncbi:hypothetical protein TeGR_g12085, partial [Tetraparma gracilis]
METSFVSTVTVPHRASQIGGGPAHFPRGLPVPGTVHDVFAALRLPNPLSDPGPGRHPDLSELGIPSSALPAPPPPTSQPGPFASELLGLKGEALAADDLRAARLLHLAGQRVHALEDRAATLKEEEEAACGEEDFDKAGAAQAGRVAIEGELAALREKWGMGAGLEEVKFREINEMVAAGKGGEGLFLPCPDMPLDSLLLCLRAAFGSLPAEEVLKRITGNNPPLTPALLAAAVLGPAQRDHAAVIARVSHARQLLACFGEVPGTYLGAAMLGQIAGEAAEHGSTRVKAEGVGLWGDLVQGGVWGEEE